MTGKKMLLNFSDWNRLVESNRIDSGFNSVYKSAIFEDEQISLIPDWLEWTRDVLWTGSEQSCKVMFVNSDPQLKISADLSGTEGVSIIQIDFKGAKCFKNAANTGIESTGPLQLFARSNEPWWIYESIEDAKAGGSKSTMGKFTSKWDGFLFKKIRETAGNPAMAQVDKTKIPSEIGANGTAEWAKGKFLKMLWNSNARLKWTYISLYNLGIIDQAKADINKQIKLPKNITFKDPGVKSSFYDIQKNIESSFKTNESLRLYEQDEYYVNVVDDKGNPIEVKKYNVIDELIETDSMSWEEHKKILDKKEEYVKEGYKARRKSEFTGDMENDLSHWLILEREFDEIKVQVDRKTGKLKAWINKLKGKTKGAIRTVLEVKDPRTLKAQQAIALAEIECHQLLKEKFPKEFRYKKDSISRNGLEKIRELYNNGKLSKSEFNRFRAVLYDFDWELKQEEFKAGKSAIDRFWDNLKGFGSDVYDASVEAYKETKRIVGDIKDKTVETADDAAKAFAQTWNKAVDEIPGMEEVDWLVKEIEKGYNKGKEDLYNWGKDEFENLIETTMMPYGVYISLDNIEAEITELNNPATTQGSRNIVPTVKGNISGTLTVITKVKGKEIEGLDIEVKGEIGLKANVDLATKKLKVEYQYSKLTTDEEEDLSSIFSDFSLNSLFPYFKIYDKDGKSTIKLTWYLGKYVTGKEAYSWEYNLQKDLDRAISSGLKKYDGYGLDSYLTGIPSGVTE